MEVIMLAAGMGKRLSHSNGNHLPKCLIRFENKSLLERHVEILKSCHLKKINLVIGYRANDIKNELSNLNALGFVETIFNPDYKHGSIISLSCASHIMNSGSDVLFMDADVLYHPELIKTLVSHKKSSHILYDKNFVPGEEPVMLCINKGEIKEFQKNVNVEYDEIGEWPGFVRWDSKAAKSIAAIINRRIEEGQIMLPCEEAFREYMLRCDREIIYSHNITGIPWIEIDFPADVEHAQNTILPALKSYTR